MQEHSKGEVIKAVFGIVFFVGMIWLSTWSGDRVDAQCKATYGQSAKIHRSRSMNECLLPDGSIKGL